MAVATWICTNTPIMLHMQMLKSEVYHLGQSGWYICYIVAYLQSTQVLCDRFHLSFYVYVAVKQIDELLHEVKPSDKKTNAVRHFVAELQSVLLGMKPAKHERQVTIKLCFSARVILLFPWST